MAHCGLKYKREGLFRKWGGQAEMDIRLFDHVAGRVCRECGDRSATGDVGEDGTVRAMDLVAEIETAFGCPGELAMADSAAGEFQQQQRVVFALGLVVVDEAGAPGQGLDAPIFFAEALAGRLV